MRILFAGTPDFSVPVLQALMDAGHQICAVYTQPDRPKGRGRKLSPSPVKVCAQSHGLPIEQPKSLRQKDAQAALAAYQPELMVVVAYGLILPRAVLETPALGCVNVHASLLPKYRGASPIQAAVLNGDKTSGVTIMQMDEGLDTGDMILKRECNIGAQDTAADLHDALSTMGASAIVDAVHLLESKQATFEKQDDTKASYAGKITKEDALIDWSKPAATIHQQIRAYHPWPVAYSSLNDQVIRIWQAELLSTEPHQYQAGEIVEVAKKHLHIACGQGILAISQLQLVGGKSLSIADFLNAKRSMFVVGDCFQ